LCSNWARYITGHLLVVDGGCSLSAKPRGWFIFIKVSSIIFFLAS
jgi:hypothetical protein